MTEFLNGRVTLLPGDCLDVLATLPENSIDACVCDPPYHLTSIVKRFGANGAAEAKEGATGAYKRASAGFMGKQWDGGDIAFQPATWAAVLRVLKPGGYLVAFSGTRTYHRMACAIEDAGFDIRDMIGWLYGSGFPKSLDIPKAIVNRLGAERSKVRVDAADVRNPKATGAGRDGMDGATRPWIEAALERGYHEKDSATAATPQAAQWDGWGTALKPAQEPICLARKPLDGTNAENVLKWGTGGLNIDGTRVGWQSEADAAAAAAAANGFADSRAKGTAQQSVSIGKESRDGTNNYDPAALKGRWPANIITDGSEEALSGFPVDVDGVSAGRYFYSPKADATDRLGSKHPTVKPIDLMQYLCRLVTPPGGTVLDCFAGTGSTGEAAWREGFKAILIEREAEYQADIARRMDLAEHPSKRAAVAASKNKLQGAEGTPLFGGLDGTENAGGGKYQGHKSKFYVGPAEPSAQSD